MCTICGCGNMASGDMPRVIRPELMSPAGEYGNYALPGALIHDRETVNPAPDRLLLGAGAVYAGDGTIAHAGAAGAIPEEQRPWGWGYEPAMPDEDVDDELTQLPMQPAGYNVRQQDAARRDVGLELLRGDGVRRSVAPALDITGGTIPAGYLGYAPAPFAGACPITGALLDETDAITGAGVGTLHTVQSRY
jgi:hypothetical protein